MQEREREDWYEKCRSRENLGRRFKQDILCRYITNDGGVLLEDIIEYMRDSITEREREKKRKIEKERDIRREREI